MEINTHIGNVDIKIDTKRIDKNLREAQKLLNEQIVADCDTLIPFQQGALRDSVNYPQGIYGGEIEYNTPYARFQYRGELYLTASGSSWAKKYEKKYPSGKPLHYHPKGTERGDHWFEKAKQQHKDDWVKLVKETVGRD